VPRWTSRNRLAAVLVTVAVASMVAAHVGRTDDWRRYDHRSFTVAAIVGGDAIQLDDGTRVRLLGLADPTPAAAGWLADHVLGRAVTLLLPPVGARDGDGRLVAYAYDADGACVNVELVGAGLAYADRRTVDPLAGLIDPAESEARRKGRGVWHGLRIEQMPPWRQAWLRAREH
jgi:endonuclease YncB( thermonuclease family)